MSQTYKANLLDLAVTSLRTKVQSLDKNSKNSSSVSIFKYLFYALSKSFFFQLSSLKCARNLYPDNVKHASCISSTFCLQFVLSRWKLRCGLLVLNKEREKIITSLLSAVNPWQKLTQMKLAKGALSTASKTYKRKSSCFSHDSQNYAVLIHCHLVHLPVTLLSNKTNLNELIWIRWKIRFLGWECDLLFPWKSGLHFPHCTNR